MSESDKAATKLVASVIISTLVMSFITRVFMAGDKGADNTTQLSALTVEVSAIKRDVAEIKADVKGMPDSGDYAVLERQMRDSDERMNRQIEINSARLTELERGRLSSPN